MVMCFVPECKHYSEQKMCKFFVFPADPVEKKRWISLIRRQDREPSKHSLVCSCHFVNKERKNGPTLFQFNVKRKFSFDSPGKKQRVAKTEETACAIALDYQEAGPSGVASRVVSPVAPSTATSHQDTFSPEDTPSCSRSISRPSGASCDAENYFLKKHLEEVTIKMENLATRIGYDYIKKNDAHVLMYTGIPTNILFLALFEMMDTFPLKYYAEWQVKLVPKIDQMLKTLMKLRLNLPHADLAIRFNCSTATVTNIVMTWIYALHEVLFKQLMSTIPSRNRNQTCLPLAFLSFKNCRIVLDCTEMYSAIPTNMQNQRLTYRSYKHRNTWKILVGVAPNGVVTFISKAYPGSTSDKKIVEHCEILKQMVPGDLIIADKRFLIRDLLPAGVSLNIPTFLSTLQFTETQVYETQRIVKARIHVERAIRRIKCFSIL